MSYRIPVQNGSGDIMLILKGAVDDETWKERQQVCEDRFAARTPDTMRREKGSWVSRDE